MSDFRETVNFKAAQFVSEINKSSMTYEVKRTRATWDPSLSIPGTGRRGGWRCPVGTRYGGQITDRFGRNCGWGAARRLANAISDIGERMENIGDRRRERRADRAVNRMRAAKPDRGGMLERAAGRAARALEGDNQRARDSWADPNNLGTPDRPRARRRRPNQINAEQAGPRRRERDSWADPNNLAGARDAVPSEEIAPKPRKRGKRNVQVQRAGNLRQSERRRMEREIERPGATRTPIDGDAPRKPPAKKPRPAPKARRREASASVAKDKKRTTPPKADTPAKEPTKEQIESLKKPNARFEQWYKHLGNAINLEPDDRQRLKDLWDAEEFGDDAREAFRDEVYAGNWGDEDALRERINQNNEEFKNAGKRVGDDLKPLLAGEMEGQKRIDALDRMVVNLQEQNRRQIENDIFEKAIREKPWNNPESSEKKPKTPTPKAPTPKTPRGVDRLGNEIPPQENVVERHKRELGALPDKIDDLVKGLDLDDIENVFGNFWGDDSRLNIHGGRQPGWAEFGDRLFRAEKMKLALDAEIDDRRKKLAKFVADNVPLGDLPDKERLDALRKYRAELDDWKVFTKMTAESLKRALDDYKKEIQNFLDNNDLIGEADQRRVYNRALNIVRLNIDALAADFVNNKYLNDKINDADEMIKKLEDKLIEVDKNPDVMDPEHRERFEVFRQMVFDGNAKVIDWANLRYVLGDAFGSKSNLKEMLDNDNIAKWVKNDEKNGQAALDNFAVDFLNDGFKNGRNINDLEKELADMMLRAVQDFEQHKKDVGQDLRKAVATYSQMLKEDKPRLALEAQAIKIVMLNKQMVSAQAAIKARAEMHNKMIDLVNKRRAQVGTNGSPSIRTPKPKSPTAPPSPSLIEQMRGNILKPFNRKARGIEGGLRPQGDDNPFRFAKARIDKKKFKTPDEAIKFVQDGGNLDDVPHDMWLAAIEGNPDKFMQIAKNGGAIGDTRIFVVRDENGKPTRRGWVFKAASPDDNMGEVIGFNLAAAHGFDLEGAVRDGAKQGGKRFMVIPFAWQNIPEEHEYQKGGWNNFNVDGLDKLPDRAHPQRLAHALHNYLLGVADRHGGNGFGAVFKDKDGNLYPHIVPIDQGWAGRTGRKGFMDYMNWDFSMDSGLISGIQELGKKLGRDHIDAVMAEYDKIVERAGRVIDAGFDDFKNQALAAYPGVRGDAALNKIKNVWDTYVRNHARLEKDRDDMLRILLGN